MINYSRKKAFLLACFLLAGIFVSAQEATGDSGKPADESQIVLGAGNPEAGQSVTNTKEPSSVWILVRIVVVLALVCGGIYGVVYLLKKTSRMDVTSDKFLKSVASLPLAPNRSLQVVTTGTQAFLIGITEKNISLISEITDRELIDAMILESDRKAPVPGGNFAALVTSLIPSKQKSAANPESKAPESAIATADFLRRQRERLTGGKEE